MRVSSSRGWCYGEPAFRQELLGQMAQRMGEHHYAAEWQESGEEQARCLVAGELQRLGWTAAELKVRRKGDPQKVRLAARLRAETTMTLK